MKSLVVAAIVILVSAVTIAQSQPNGVQKMSQLNLLPEAKQKQILAEEKRIMNMGIDTGRVHSQNRGDHPRKGQRRSGTGRPRRR